MLVPGEIFAGRYRVERELGRGGLGVVYACEHIHTGQKVALKLLLTEPQRAPELERVVREKFQLEQRIWSHAPSEHIVRVLDAGNLDADQREVGDAAAGTLYIVMELLDGETLQQRVEELGALPPAEVVDVLQQIARGLDRAHACRGPDGKPAPILHRDLTPKNIIIGRRAEGSWDAKLLDFGIAKQLFEDAKLTDALLGTRVYTAPEQVRGQPLSAQTDVWSFGLTAYFALTGRDYGRDERAHAHLPREFARWFSRCVEEEPSRRFGSASEAAAELALALAGVEALTPSARGAHPGNQVTSLLATRETAAPPPGFAPGGDAVTVLTDGHGPKLTAGSDKTALEPSFISRAAPFLRPPRPRTEGISRGSSAAKSVERPVAAQSSAEPRRLLRTSLAVAAAALGGAAYFITGTALGPPQPEAATATEETRMTARPAPAPSPVLPEPAAPETPPATAPTPTPPEPTKQDAPLDPPRDDPPERTALPLPPQQAPLPETPVVRPIPAPEVKPIARSEARPPVVVQQPRPAAAEARTAVGDKDPYTRAGTDVVLNPIDADHGAKGAKDPYMRAGPDSSP